MGARHREGLCSLRLSFTSRFCLLPELRHEPENCLVPVVWAGGGHNLESLPLLWD